MEPRTSFSSLIRFLEEGNLDAPEVWEELTRRVDIVSAVDFVIAEGWGHNYGFGGNREIWLDHRPGSKWRFTIPDMDKTFGSEVVGPVMARLISSDQVIRRIRHSQNFKRLLAQRYAVHLVTTFEESRIHGLIDHYSALMSVELPRQRDRWEGIPTVTNYNSSIQRMKDHATDRSADVIQEIQTVLGMDPAVTLSLVANGNGSFEIEGVPFEQGSLEVFPNIGLNLKAVSDTGYQFDGWVEVAGDSELETVLTQATTLTAQFSPSTGTPVGGILSMDTTFSLSGSPYVVESDLVVPVGTTLSIEEGVSVEMFGATQFRVQGKLDVYGSVDLPVSFSGRNGEPWGGISFEQTTTTSTLSHLTVRNTRRGYDPVTYPAGISGLDSDVVIEFLNIEGGMAPLFFRGGSLILRDSYIHIPVTGDGVNVKQGQAQTIRCVFLGNNAPDTDAIDYDGVVNGLIQDCQIYRFFGFNSDGIDVGEQCVDVLIEGNQIYYNSDKGISVGQGSTVISKDNLIVGCPIGVGVKDTGSNVTVDQNTFVDCEVRVWVYEKNFGAGGGQGVILNSIFSGSVDSVLQDSLSTLSVDYSLSDRHVLPGINNLLASPEFTDPSVLDFSLQGSSPAKDSGDPAHALDPDSTRADRGSFYTYDPSHYPFLITNTIVVNELLSNSGGDHPDWLELHNRSTADMNIGGWFLSDDAGALTKYQIPEGTVIPAGGYLVFDEDQHFGPESSDPGRYLPFSLSDSGETVYLSSGTGGMLTDYRHKKDFDASLEGVTLGNYFKPSTETYNFVAQRDASPGSENGEPAVGPIVISEIMYDPPLGASEYIELLNISDSPVRLYDSEKRAPWGLTSGIVYAFQTNVVLDPGERMFVVQDLSALSAYNFNPLVRRYQWSSGRLNNGGEAIELIRPGPLRNDGRRAYTRVDRVKYDDDEPWPLGAQGSGLALRKISEGSYGNDFMNWIEASPTPGNTPDSGRYELWAADRGGLTVGGDADGDQIPNLLEYAMGTNPMVANENSTFEFRYLQNSIQLDLGVSVAASDVDLMIERSSDLSTWTRVNLTPTETINGIQKSELALPLWERYFFRAKAELKP